MEMKMNKEEYIKVLMVKTNRSEGECNILNQIIENHFIVGKNIAFSFRTICFHH